MGHSNTDREVRDRTETDRKIRKRTEDREIIGTQQNRWRGWRQNRDEQKDNCK